MTPAKFKTRDERIAFNRQFDFDMQLWCAGMCIAGLIAAIVMWL